MPRYSSRKNTKRSTGNIADKVFNAAVKQNARVAADTCRYVNLMEIQQRMNYSKARINLRFRQMDRSITGVEPGWFAVAYDWIIIHLMYLWGLLLGFITPIFTLLLLSIFRAAIIIVCNFIFFYLIYQLLFK